MRTNVSATLQAMIGIAVLTALGFLFAPGSVSGASENEQKAFNEKAAKTHMRLIVNSMYTYQVKYGVFPASLAVLCKEGILNKPEMANCSAPGVNSKPLNGYLFQMTAGKSWTSTAFYVRCRPESTKDGIQCFDVDFNGKVITTNSY